jgi:hypothetical protein
LVTGPGPQKTLAATVVNGLITSAKVGNKKNNAAGYTDMTPVNLKETQIKALGSVAQDQKQHTVDIPGLGSYRVQYINGNNGDYYVGVPTSDVDNTINTLIIVEISLTVAGLLAAGLAGTVMVGVATRPLRKVAATATRVSELPLHTGEVNLSERVPETETQGRIHTSTCTVAVLPQLSEAEFHLDLNDVQIDTFRSSGAGGQKVNKTSSAIRVTHLPTGTVVECQDERSQHKNRARAMSLLKARLLDAERSKQSAAQAESRRLQVGSGDRSQRIRTYSYPQGRITDHRINLTLYRLLETMQGDLDELIDTLTREHQADELQNLIGGG